MMHDRYAGRWFNSLTFIQKTTVRRPDGTENVSTWYEAMLGSRLRIDMGEPSLGNGALSIIGGRGDEVVGQLCGDRPAPVLFQRLGDRDARGPRLGGADADQQFDRKIGERERAVHQILPLFLKGPAGLAVLALQPGNGDCSHRHVRCA